VLVELRLGTLQFGQADRLGRIAQRNDDEDHAQHRDGSRNPERPLPRGLSSSMAGWTVAIFEVCGITGMLLAGWISDKFFGGRAQRTCVFCMAGVILFISLFFALPESTDPVVLLMMLAVAGFFIYGPQALIGVIASNHATKKAASTANGVVGMVSYVSVVVSGWGFGFISDHFGWRWVFITMIAMAVLGFLVLLSMWNTKSDGYEHDAAETN